MEAIYDTGAHLDLVITLSDHKSVRKSGRVYLDEFCNARAVPLLKVNHINDQEVLSAIKKYELDWLFVIGWSQIANNSVLTAPNRGVLGIHPTLLPQGRGRAAIPWAILKGLDRTGVTLFKLDAGVDTGPIISQRTISLSRSTTATDLYMAVDLAHVALIRDIIPALLNDTVSLTEQDESKASIWPGRTPDDGLIDLNGSVHEAEKLIRATTHPYPGAFFYKNDRKVVVWSAKYTSMAPSNSYLQFYDGYLLLKSWEYSQ